MRGFDAEFAVADRTTDFGFMIVQEGHIAGFRGTISGLKDGRSVIECRFVWKLGADMTPHWPVTHGNVIEIEGDPGVCAAPAGIVNQMDLPFVRGAHTIR